MEGAVRAGAADVDPGVEGLFQLLLRSRRFLLPDRRHVRACCPPPAIKASMSCLLMRPPAPVPVTPLKSMPCSLAMRRTSGEL